MKSTISAITGKERICGVIGDPITHSLSPMIHNTLAKNLGHRMTYVPFEVKKQSLEEAIRGAYALGVQGLNVTMPHKQELAGLVTSCDEWAGKVGAINTLVYTPEGYKGYNTDCYGTQKALEQMGCDYSGKNVVIIGSGGAAYAAAFCVVAQARTLHLFNRTVSKAKVLRDHLGAYTQTPIFVYDMAGKPNEKIDVVIQTTGVGMGELAGQIPDCAQTLLTEATYAMDMIYSPWETAFVKAAKARGIHTINGFSMLYYQAVKAYELMNECICEAHIVKEIKEEIEIFVEKKWLKEDLH